MGDDVNQLAAIGIMAEIQTYECVTIVRKLRCCDCVGLISTVSFSTVLASRGCGSTATLQILRKRDRWSMLAASDRESWRGFTDLLRRVLPRSGVDMSRKKVSRNSARLFELLNYLKPRSSWGRIRSSRRVDRIFISGGLVGHIINPTSVML